MAKLGKKDAKKLLEEARDRYKLAMDADRENRQKALEDLKFVHEPNAQWEPEVLKERGKSRPAYEFNKLRISIKRVVNDIRANRPQGKVRAVEDGDKDTAGTLEGLLRNIWTVSDGDAAVDIAAEYQVAGGYGAWRIVTEYADDSSWDQDIRVKPIPYPFCLIPDPAAQEHMRRDARYWFLVSKISKEAFEAKYGSVPAIEFESDEFDDDDWEEEEAVRICEYWYRKPIQRTLALLADGRTVDVAVDNPPPELVTRTRTVQTWQICMIVMSGDRVLEGPVEWPGAHFPFVPVYGEQLVIDGKRQWFGLTRHAKDAQRAYNVARTATIETIALTPQAKTVATAKQLVNHFDKWAVAHKENLPVLLYDHDPQAPGPPQRLPGAEVPVALIQESQISSEDIKSVTGIYDASLGQRSNETTGIAIRARQQQGEIANFNYADNIARAIRRTWEILIDLVPRIYDAERSIRILGADGAEQYVRVNSVDPLTGQVMNDLSRGKYDVTVTVGPSFSTQRQEAAEIYTALSQGNPAIAAVAGDLIVKTLDMPYSEEMAERMRTILPPQVQQMLAQKEQSGGGKALPPEAQAAMAQANQAMQMVEQQSQLVQAAAAEVEQGKADAEKAAANVEKQAAKMAADYERMKADITRREAELTLREAQMTKASMESQSGESRESIAQERQALASEVQQAVIAIQQQAATILQDALKALSTMQPTVVVANQPKSKVVRVRRVNGELVGEVQEAAAGDAEPVQQQIAQQLEGAQSAIASQAEATAQAATQAVMATAQQVSAVLEQQTQALAEAAQQVISDIAAERERKAARKVIRVRRVGGELIGEVQEA